MSHTALIPTFAVTRSTSCRTVWTLWMLILMMLISRTAWAQEPTLDVPAEVAQRLQLDPFYRQYLEVEGLPVLGSQKVSPAALREAGWIVRQMLSQRPEILRAMAKNKTRLVVMAYNEYTTDIPEHRSLQPRVFWDRRARGLGATPDAPAVSCAEENLLGFPGDPYSTENICIHEFAHAIHEMGMPLVDPTFDTRLQAAYDASMAQGLWKETYAAGNRHEYWAEGVQSWFDDNRENDSLHNHVNRRDELREYDPRLATLCEEVFGDIPWRYVRPHLRSAVDQSHLVGYNAKSLPQFRWRDEPIPARPRVLIQTTLGDIEVELDAEKAPRTVENFLHYVHQGLLADGSFHRSVRLDNQPDDAVKIEVIQAAANPAQQSNFPATIPLERTRDTGITHRDGAISMARDADADSGRDHFFICIGDQPELDFGGKRNPDGQGFAAFGQVTTGMEVVRRIQQSTVEGQSLKPPIRIQRAVRQN